MKYLALFALVLLTGCATYDFIPYSGQQKKWPVAAGAFVRVKEGIPIYQGPPDKPYTVLGLLTSVDADDYGYALQARRHHADAVVIMDTRTSSSGSMYLPGQSITTGTAQRYGNTYYGNSTTTTLPGYSIPVESTYSAAYLIKFTAP